MCPNIPDKFLSQKWKNPTSKFPLQLPYSALSWSSWMNMIHIIWISLPIIVIVITIVLLNNLRAIAMVSIVILVVPSISLATENHHHSFHHHPSQFPFDISQNHSLYVHLNFSLADFLCWNYKWHSAKGKSVTDIFLQ